MYLAFLTDKDDKNLIGDKSKEYCLPTVPSKHPDLKGIGPEAVSIYTFIKLLSISAGTPCTF